MKNKQEKTEKHYMISDKKLEEIKKNAKNEGISEAFPLFLAFSVMTISDHIEDLMVVGSDKGKSTEERFTDYVLELWDAYTAGEIQLQDCLDCLKDECGITINMNRNVNRII